MDTFGFIQTSINNRTVATFSHDCMQSSLLAMRRLSCLSLCQALASWWNVRTSYQFQYHVKSRSLSWHQQWLHDGGGSLSLKVLHPPKVTRCQNMPTWKDSCYYSFNVSNKYKIKGILSSIKGGSTTILQIKPKSLLQSSLYESFKKQLLQANQLRV